MTIEKLRPNYTFTEDKLNKLKEVIPEAFADGKINFETVKEILGEYLEEENLDKEHFGLFWVGKRQAHKIASIPSKGTLIPVKGDGIDEENTKNIFIEGDNLEVLKLLQKSYASKIKMIYIDPPYNTGNDFVYEDDFSEPIKEYLRRTGQIDEQGKELTTNKKSDGRYHAKWLSMMYPRLSLARNLLKEDGVIFISIDDNEVHNLRLLCNEIFGEENFIAEFIWKSRQNKDNRSITGVSTDHEYILCFTRGFTLNIIRGEERKTEQYQNPDNDPRGPWVSGNMLGIATENQRPNLHYELVNPKTGIKYEKPKMGWRYDRNTMSKLIEEERILWPSEPAGRPRKKTFLNELKGNFTGLSSVFTEGIYTKDGTSEIDSLFGFRAFDFPKPSSLIKNLITQATNNGDIIIDFFGGSGTTAHSILALNEEDEENRSFICVQIPEKTSEASEAFKVGYKYISEITKDRIRRAIKKIKNDNEGKLEFKENNQDLGFKVFKLTESNYKEWKDVEKKDSRTLEIEFIEFLNPLIENWKKDDLLSEIIIIEGFSLDSKIKQLPEYNKNQVYEITSEFCNHKLLVSLDQNLDENTIDSLVLDENDIFICLDIAINDNYKIKLSDKGLIKTI